MKIKIFLFTFITAFIWTGCSKEENIIQETNEQIELRHTKLIGINQFKPCDAISITICVNSCIDDSPWECGVEGAIAAYNDLPENIGIHMEIISNCAIADIQINCKNIIGAAGETFLFTNGDETIRLIFLDTGSTLSQYPCTKNNDDATCCQLQWIVMHELGHALGFGHTDDNVNYEYIPGTAIEDLESVFISGFQHDPCDDKCEFSDGDVAALEIMYPPFIPTPVPPLSGPKFICNIGETVTYCIPTGIDINDWIVPNNMTEVQRTENCITVTLNSSNGLDPLKVDIVDLNGCNSVFSYYINTHEFPSFDFTYNGPICLGDVVNFSLKPIPASQKLRATEWHIESGGLNILSSNGRFAVVEALYSGLATICATAVNDCGLEKTECVDVMINRASDCTPDGELPNPK